MVTNQVQIRRDTATNLDAATPVIGELGYDTTNKRLRLGDGSTLGGIRTPNANDLQFQSFYYSSVGGTANAITLTNSPPIGGYSNGLRLKFKAPATNTGAVTVDVDGQGTKNIYKLSGSTLIACTGNEIITGVIYELNYDGTQFQLLSGASGGATDYQQFTSSGTWTKPTGFDSNAMVLIECWGAGAGGVNSSSGTSFGGNTSFGSHVIAYGGSAGFPNSRGGCGGGLNGQPVAGGDFNDAGEGYGAGMDSSHTGAPFTPSSGTITFNRSKNGFYTGGGGGGGSSVSGGDSVYGGGGGGGYSAGAGGTSKYGGNGGSVGSAGSAPSGGGGGANSSGGYGGGGGSYKYRFMRLSELGATETVTIGAGSAGASGAGAGARGECRVFVFG